MNAVDVNSVDVAIVGAGPTGIVLAILLADRGHSVALLERQTAPYPLPRAVAFDHEVGRILQSCGIGDRLREQIEPADTYEWRNADGVTLLMFANSGVGACGWPQTSMFNQPTLERLLAEQLAGRPSIALHRGRELTSFDDEDGQGVTLWHRAPSDATEPAGAGAESITARYLIGCDGANSTVRTQLGIGFEDLGFFFDWLVVDVILDDTSRVFDPINLQVCDPGRPTTIVSGGPGRRRWEFMRLPDETPDELSGEAAAWRLLDPWDVRPDNARLERHANYTFRARWAERWRSGSVLLAGDAAHQMPPFAGQGMCSGIRDAANLAWKLDLVLHDLAPESLLDSYEAERVPNVRAVIDFSIDLGKIICIPDPVEAAARDEFMISLLAADGEPSATPPLPGLSTGILEAGSPTAGALFLQGVVGSADGDSRGERPIDDVVGLGFRLVTVTPIGDALSAKSSEWFDSIGGAIVVLDDAGSISDVRGQYGDWFDRHGVVAVLQRPDSYIFGTASTRGAIETLVQSLRTMIETSPPR